MSSKTFKIPRAFAAVVLCAFFTFAFLTATAFAGISPFANTGTFFAAQIEHVSSEGQTDTVECTFAVVSEASKTCEVAGSGKYDGTRAVNSSTSGAISVPSTVVHEGITYTVVGVGQYAFGGVATSSCTQLSKVGLPDTVTYVDNWAFANCSSLAEYPVPDGASRIGDHAFYYCRKLPNRITFSASLKSIEQYAFCGCSSLRTIEFAANCPAIADYAFTGAGMAVQSVVCNGTGPEKVQSTVFNGQSTGLPTVYYKVRFYASKGASQVDQNCLGTIYVASNVTKRRINYTLSTGLYSGEVPMWPEGTNLWVFDGAEGNYNSGLTTSTVAYPTKSDYQDLSNGKTSDVKDSYTGLDARFNHYVADSLGCYLDDDEFTVSYERQNAEGEWEPTNDLVTEGQLRFTCTAASSSIYTGSLTGMASIVFDEGSNFKSPVSVTADDGTVTQEDCWFKVVNLAEDGSAEIAVAQGNHSFYLERENSLYVDYLYPKAVSRDVKGYVVVPDELEACGHRCRVTQIERGAFGEDSENSMLVGGADSMSGIEIPSGVCSVGSDAFRANSNLRKVVFRGDARNVDWGQTVFKGCSSVDMVVWMGRKADNDFLFSTELLGSADAPTNYYTVRYYASEDDYNAAVDARKARDDAWKKRDDRPEDGEDVESSAIGDAVEPQPIGSITVSENVQLAFVETAKDVSTGLYAGSLPAFPSNFKDDGYWLAPTWLYRDADVDNQKALMNGLPDSGYAFAAQSNDCYTLDDVFFKGVANGVVKAYTGEPLFDASKIDVASGIGRLLQQGVDYDIAFMRQSTTEQDKWVETEDLVNGGALRVVAMGKGSYSGSSYVEVQIDAGNAEVGTEFEVQLPAVLPDGTQTTVACNMKVTSLGDSPRAAVTPSAVKHPWGEGSTSTFNCAIDPDFEGSISIPATVYCNGVALSVTELLANSFLNCHGITSVQLPDTLLTVGASAFSNCTSLGSIRIPDSVTKTDAVAFSGCTSLVSAYVNGLADSGMQRTRMFSGCTSLEKVEFGPGNTGVPQQAFDSCTALSEVELNEGVTSIGAGAFQNARKLLELELPTTVNQVDTSAFSNSSLETLVFADGTKQVSKGLLQGNKWLKKVVLPQSVETIGAYAFMNSSIEAVELPDGITSVESNAFFGCSSLVTVIFDGNPDTIGGTAFASCTKIKTVIYRAESLSKPRQVFAKSNPTYYCTVYFYGSADAMESDLAYGSGAPANRKNSIGMVSVKKGTGLSKINDRSVAASSIVEGEIPAFPEGTNLWEFDGSPALNSKLENGTSAYARQADYTSLADAKAVLQQGYRYSGETIDPFGGGYATVVDAAGVVLSDETHYTVKYQRRDADGQWVDTDDLVSIGGVQAVISATPGGGYTGALTVRFSITRHLTGDVFTAPDGNGHDVTYKVTSIGDEVLAGTVSVGIGGEGSQAVDQESTGTLTIPETVADPQYSGDAMQMAYRPTAVSSYAFYRCMGITEVQLPSGIESIGKKAFAYDRQKTDTKLSELATLDFGMNMQKVHIADDAFSGCNDISTIVYRDKRGSFSAFGESNGYQVYLTTRYYASREAVGVEQPLAAVTAKELSYAHSLSDSDYYKGSDKTPEEPENCKWAYDSSAQDDEGRTIDSMNVFARSLDNSKIVADVVVTQDGVEKNVTCTFEKLVDADHNYTGEVRVGSGEDGNPAISAGTSGTVKIPSEVSDSSGGVWKVVEIGPFAFGSSAAEEACKIGGVTVPSSVGTIGASAFQNCRELSTVMFEDGSGLKSIEGSAFAGTSSLASMRMPEGLKQIGASAFASSGLVRLRIPWSVETLGKGAFSGSSQLCEVVFGGRMSLSLPAPDGADERWSLLASIPDPSIPVDGASKLDNACHISQIDDYVFANCRSLARIVFDSAADGVKVSEVAFEGTSSLADVVFGDARAPWSAVDGAYGSSAPNEWVTVSYFANAEKLAQLDRMAYICVRPGAVLSKLGADDVLAGTIPEPPQYWEWTGDVDIAQPVADSAYLFAQKIRYAIDMSGVDPGLGIVFEVDGERVVDAPFADEVSVLFESVGMATVESYRIVNTATGEVLLSGEGEPSGAFTMPGNAVEVVAVPQLGLTLSVQSMGDKAPIEVAQLSLSDMEEMAAGDDPEDGSGTVDAEPGTPAEPGMPSEPETPSDPATLVYSAWDRYGNVEFVQTSQCVELQELLSRYGIRFASGDSLVLYSDDAYIDAISYDELFSDTRSYYPNLVQDSSDGAVEVPVAIAVRSSEASASALGGGTVAGSDAQDGSQPGTGQAMPQESLKTSYRLLMGQTFDEASSGRDTYSRCSGQITSLVVLKGPEDISNGDFEVSGIEPEYAFTGDGIEPELVLQKNDGTVLEKDTDFEVTFTNNVEPGTAGVRIDGIGKYKGTIESGFRILRAQSTAGSSREDTAAQTAIEAYPDGCEGVIVATGYAFPDSLSAASLSGAMGYPLLLTQTETLSGATEDAIRYLSSGKDHFFVMIAGGEGAVSENVENQIAQIVPGGADDVSRIAGYDRFNTSYLMWFVGSKYGEDGLWSKTAVLANGYSFPDALSISAYAAWSGSPILLTDPDELFSDTKEALQSGGFDTIVVVGGQSSVTDKVAQAAAEAAGAKVVRLAGGNRYQTSAAIAKWEVEQGMTCDGAAIASGEAFPDGLSGGPAFGRSGSVLLLASGDNAEALAILGENKDDVCSVRFLGGTSALPVSVRTATMDILGWKHEMLE